MKVLVVGSGGREHALAWKISQSSRVQCVYVAPGNGGTAIGAAFKNIPITDLKELADFVETECISFTIVGPEVPLAAGIVNFFRARGLKIFGPTKEAMQLESSKCFAKAFMMRHGIATAAYQSFLPDEMVAAHQYIDHHGAPVVIKADGLAAGKGVVVAMDVSQAHAAVDRLLAPSMVDASARIVIEAYLSGEEVSFIVMVDGKNILPLATSQDHKRLRAGDEGPNTGGMGACSPAAIVTPALHDRIMREIIEPTVMGMHKEGIPFTGFLYAGLMIDATGHPSVLEFNCRLGDPETQSIMVRLKSDFFSMVEHAINGSLGPSVELSWDRRTAIGVVMTTRHYPDTPHTGDIISDIPINTSDCLVFHAGTCLSDDGKSLVTSGGRVLCVVGLGDGVRAAQQCAYDTIQSIHFDGAYYRNDIGSRMAQQGA